MSFRRLGAVILLELRTNSRRPAFWILIAIVALTAFGLSSGNVTISSGDSSVGGTKVWINSQFAIAQITTMMVFLLYSFFATMTAGTAVLDDDTLGVGELLHSTPLRPAEYVWGKYLGVLLSFGAVGLIHMTLTALFFQLMPTANASEIRGPFHFGAYLVPALAMALPTVVFFSGTAFGIGERSRRPILIALLPVAFITLAFSFLFGWSPSWLDLRWNRLLMAVDPSGFRWLNETWLKVDRGVDFYNTQPLTFDWVFWVNRSWIVVAGLGMVAASVGHLRRAIAGDMPTRRRSPIVAATATESTVTDSTTTATQPTLANLRMVSRRPSLFEGLLEVTRTEARELRHQPGLYLFVPLILAQVIGAALLAIGPFGIPLIVTSGTIAVGAMNTLTLLVCLLLLFYTVESLERERTTGFAQIYYATPLRTASILFGKALANSVVGVVILLASLLGAIIALLVAHRAPFEIAPFALVWGLLLVPTFLVWASFATALYALTRERYTTYALALAALIATGYFQFRGKMIWPFNWNLWSAISWSDLGTFELERGPLLLNRAAVLGLSVLFVAVSVRLFGRRDLDHGRAIHRLAPRSITRGALRLAPFAVVPAIALGVLGYQVRQGYQGEPAEKAAKDYWRRNFTTWNEAPLPAISFLDLDLDLEPAARSFVARGTFTISNHRERPLGSFPFTISPSWDDLAWTVDGAPFEPEDRSGLVVFDLGQPIAPGESHDIGFSHHGRVPDGATKNGGGTGQFILPSGVVLHMFSPSFLPVLGFLEGIGIDEDNRYQSKDFPADHYRQVLEPALGTPLPFRTRVRVTTPEAYTANSVGALVEEGVVDGKRIAVWESDYPVKLLNVVAGRWEVRRAGGTAVFFHPQHRYNIDEISEALQAARRYYSEWFFPFPWAELKLSEFPNLAQYAQGFPTNITFSEGIGFLTKSDPRTNAAFFVTAHEAAHQWWGNLVTPGNGPGANILSEGMSHYSTILLFQQVKGERERIEFCKRIEERYGDERQVDSERPLVKIDGSRAGDTTVTYDKGGWVMWMLHDLMGREAALAGLQEFRRRFIPGPDHPLLEDLVETLRPYAADPAKFQEFVDQWFFAVVVPEYRLRDHRIEKIGERWQLRVTVENAGSGRMPVEVAAERGVRFPDPEAGTASKNAAKTAEEPYLESRATVMLDAGESAEVTLDCGFEPQRVVVDPDARVLQLEREKALLRL